MITYFHRNTRAGFSIDKVSKTITTRIQDKEEFHVPSCGASVLSIIKNIFFVYRHRNKNGINHVTGDIHYCLLALIGCKSVLTIHDTVLLDFAKLSTVKRFLVKLLWFDIPLAIANRVVCISNETKKAVEKYTKRRDIIVIHNMIDESFQRLDIQHMNDSKMKILLIGTNPNKNIPRVLQATKNLDVIITIIGKLSDEMLDIINQNKLTCINKMGLTEKEIIAEYNQCDMVIFCSLFEGFGMPILEANAIGRALLCSDIPIMHEIAGNSALFVNPEDVNSISNGLTKLLSDSKLRDALIDNGFQNVKRFSPEIIMSQWNNLYNSL